MLPMLLAEHLAPPGPLVAEGDVWVRREHRAADMTIVRDVVHDDCYAVARWSGPVRRVLDIGSHLGAFGVRVRQVFPAAEVAAVDPDPAHAEVWRRNHPAGRRIEAACSPCADAALRSSVYRGTDNTGASRVEPRPPGCTAPRIATRTLSGILADLEWDTCDVVKLDCEGCELDVLADKAGLARCRTIVGEWHDRTRFLRRAAALPPGWRLTVLRDGEAGLFQLDRLR